MKQSKLQNYIKTKIQTSKK